MPIPKRLLCSLRRSAMFATLVLCGCGSGVTTTSKMTSLSPDGKWIAVAEGQEFGEFGGRYNRTVVNLSENNSPKNRYNILILSHQYLTIPLDIKWINARNLNITYFPNSKPSDSVTVDFMAASCGDVIIHVSSG